jgi:SAM-dependent methyltransferase
MSASVVRGKGTMGATSQAHERRTREGYFQKYFVGKGIDIGCGADPLLADSVQQWDILDGDAQVMAGFEPASFDYVYASHCLEHMKDPIAAVNRWWELVKPKGYLICVVPDEDLYEQALWPSRFNTDHKSTWTMHKGEGCSWSEVSYSVADVFSALPGSQLVSMRLYDAGYDYSLNQAITASVIVSQREAKAIEQNGMVTQGLNGNRCIGFFPIDQTSGAFDAEIGIEVIVRKMGNEADGD